MISLEKCVEFLRCVWTPGDVHELRCPKHKKGVISGYYDSPEKMAEAATQLSGQCEGIYRTLNPCNPALLARRCNRHNPGFDKNLQTTSDVDIVRRRLMVVDIDSAKPSGISSTNDEVGASKKTMYKVAEYLNEAGFPVPLVTFSGNGWHLLYAIDLPNDEESKALVHGFLEYLADKFNDELSHVDTTMSNASRRADSPKIAHFKQ